MKFLKRHFLPIVIVTVYSCGSHKSLIDKDRSPFGKIKFHSITKGADPTSALMYADVDSNGTRIFYSFYPTEILKTKEDDKVMKFSLYCDKHPHADNPNIFQKFSSLDSFVLKKGDSIARSYGWIIKDASECEGFDLTIYQMHGWPKGKKFKPL